MVPFRSSAAQSPSYVCREYVVVLNHLGNAKVRKDKDEHDDGRADEPVARPRQRNRGKCSDFARFENAAFVARPRSREQIMSTGMRKRPEYRAHDDADGPQMECPISKSLSTLIAKPVDECDGFQ